MTGSTALWPVLLLAYLGLGVGVAIVLARRGASSMTAISAIGCWPLLVPLLRAPATDRRTGPLGDRIERCAADLRATMADPAADDLPIVDDLDDLVRDLHGADARLAMVDALLHDVGATSPPRPAIDALRRARARAAAEVEAVLDGMVELRLAIGLRSLAGNTVPVRERLQDLRVRLGAVEEIAALELASSP